MGEILEMMEEGILCCECGIYLGSNQPRNKKSWTPTGHQTFCRSCDPKPMTKKMDTRPINQTPCSVTSGGI